MCWSPAIEAAWSKGNRTNTRPKGPRKDAKSHIEVARQSRRRPELPTSVPRWARGSAPTAKRTPRACLRDLCDRGRQAAVDGKPSDRGLG